MKKQKQVAALPWRMTEDGLEVLLVTTRTTRRWMIPKGWPMRDRADSAAAAAEAWEEAGVQGAVAAQPAGIFAYDKVMASGKTRVMEAAIYPLQVTAQLDDWPECHERTRRWMTPGEAVNAAQPDTLAAAIRQITAELATQALRGVAAGPGGQVALPPFQRLRAWLARGRR